ncbi:GNAT family N-acetyltransferase [Nocardioides anomalus]|uniref:GNAT family N-acetyltransferase n=1 Tax=Nocardioides anomalus TaxID=2712223 RepID=UPI0018AD4A2A|nr:GNAT family N-acetyltransferase [Nocardioides anomalus]
MAADLVDDTLETARLVLRPWSVDDAPDALAVFGDESVTRWLAPAVTRVPDVDDMRRLIGGWLTTPPPSPAGRWAVTTRDDGALVGALALLPLPPENDDLEIGWQLAPTAWGQGFAAEAGHAVAAHAFDRGVEELFAVVRPRNTRAARTATSIGMEWVGETDKYYDLRLQVYRLRKAELGVPRLPGA